MKTPCNVIWDLVPLYADKVCSQESRCIVEEHLAECEDCRRRFESQEKNVAPPVDFTLRLDPFKRVRKANTRRMAWNAVVAVIITALLIVGWMGYKHVFSIVDTAWSDDGTSTFVIYDRAIGIDDVESGSHFTLMEYTQLSGNRSEAFFLHWFGGSGKSHSNAVFDGVYENGYWSPDGTKFVINTTGSAGSLYIIDFAGSHVPNINLMIKECIREATRNDPQQFGYKISDGAQVELDFLQWGRDSNSMLFFYSLNDEEGENRTGYCWYDYMNGAVNTFLNMTN